MKRNFFLCHKQIYPNIAFFPIFLNFLFPPSTPKNRQKSEFQRFIASSVLKINYRWKGTFFFVTPKSTQISHFPLIFQNFLFPPSTRQKLVKTKISKVHIFVNSENKLSMKRNFFLCHTHIYPNITLSSNFLEISIPLFNLAKISIFDIKNAINLSF